MLPRHIKILLTACHLPVSERGENSLKKMKSPQYVAAKKRCKCVTNLYRVGQMTPNTCNWNFLLIIKRLYTPYKTIQTIFLRYICISFSCVYTNWQTELTLMCNDNWWNRSQTWQLRTLCWALFSSWKGFFFWLQGFVKRQTNKNIGIFQSALCMLHCSVDGLH